MIQQYTMSFRDLETGAASRVGAQVRLIAFTQYTRILSYAERCTSCTEARWHVMMNTTLMRAHKLIAADFRNGKRELAEVKCRRRCLCARCTFSFYIFDYIHHRQTNNAHLPPRHNRTKMRVILREARLPTKKFYSPLHSTTRVRELCEGFFCYETCLFLEFFTYIT